MDYYCWEEADADKLAGKHQMGCLRLAAEVVECHWPMQKGHGPQKDWELVDHRQDVGKLCRLHHRIDCSV